MRSHDHDETFSIQIECVRGRENNCERGREHENLFEKSSTQSADLITFRSVTVDCDRALGRGVGR